MTITPICSECEKELTDYGGLLFSPPDLSGSVRKYHLCISCYKKHERLIETSKQMSTEKRLQKGDSK